MVRTSQRMDVSIDPEAFLLLLPDPITCFASSSYSQSQTFRLSADGRSSAVVIDWFTSGRMARGEEWSFERYRSLNEFWIGGKRVARDVMLLEDEISAQSLPQSLSPGPRSSSLSSIEGTEQNPQPDLRQSTLPLRTIKARLAPYACYATLFLIGPQVETVVSLLASKYDSISQMQVPQPDSLVWSMSPLTLPAVQDGSKHLSGSIVRLMGMETEQVRNWLKEALQPLASSIGSDVLRAAFL